MRDQPIHWTTFALSEHEHAKIVREGIKVEFNTSGIVVYQDNVLLFPTDFAGLQLGDKQEDGTVFAGVSPHTNLPMYALPTDPSLMMKWNDAMQYAASLPSSVGRFRLPTIDELIVLYNNRAVIDNLECKEKRKLKEIWSSTEKHGDSAFHKDFSDIYGAFPEACDSFFKSNQKHVVFVRD